ncbi:MAG: kelch repeat-containing protein [bacterium]
MILRILAVVLLTGCSLDAFLCAPCEGACPGGLTCEEGLCRSAVATCNAPLVAAEAGVDAGAGDAGAGDAARADAIPPDAAPDAAPVDAAPPDQGVEPAPCVPRWTRLWPPNGPIEGDSPNTRSWSATAWAETPGGAGLVVHGGSLGNQPQSDTWIFYPGTGRWVPVATNEGPGPRTQHRLVTTPDGLLLVGGNCREGSGTLWRLSLWAEDAGTWEALDPLAPLPDRWCGFDTAVDGEQIWAFGGSANAVGLDPPPLWRIRLGDGRAVRVQRPLPEDGPLNQPALALSPDEGRLYALGGGLVPTWEPTRRVWHFDVGASAWEAGSTAGVPVLSAARAAWLPAVQRIVVFGGEIEGSLTTDALLVYDPATARWTRFSGAPSPRQGHSMAVLPEGDAVIISWGHGGVDEAYPDRDDIWKLRLACP